MNRAHRVARDRLARAAAGLAAMALVAFIPSHAVRAQELREFCPDRPGLGTPACVIDRGRVAAEAGLLDWTLDKQRSARTNTLLAGDLLVRYGITGNLEAQFGWTAFGHVRIRSGDIVESEDGIGDVTVAFRRNLRNPDRSGFSAAVMPFVTLPTGGSAIGAGNWGAGLLLPLSGELPAGFGLAFTGSIEAAADADRSGRHLAYGAVAGIDVPVAEELGITLELAARRDRDPSGAATNLLAAVSAAWSPRDALQFDAGVNIGLSRDTPDLQISVGVARRF